MAPAPDASAIVSIARASASGAAVSASAVAARESSTSRHRFRGRLDRVIGRCHILDGGLSVQRLRRSAIAGIAYRDRRRVGGRLRRRHGLRHGVSHGRGRRRRPPFHAVAQCAKHRGEIFAGAAKERGHRYRDAEAVAIGSAVRWGRRFRRRPPRDQRADAVGEALDDVDPHRAYCRQPGSRRPGRGAAGRPGRP